LFLAGAVEVNALAQGALRRFHSAVGDGTSNLPIERRALCHQAIAAPRFSRSDFASEMNDRRIMKAQHVGQIPGGHSSTWLIHGHNFPQYCIEKSTTHFCTDYNQASSTLENRKHKEVVVYLISRFLKNEI